MFILETRPAKRAPQAAVRVAVDMARERVITEREALLRLDAAQMDFFLHPTIDTSQGQDVMFGLCVSARTCHTFQIC